MQGKLSSEWWASLCAHLCKDYVWLILVSLHPAWTLTEDTLWCIDSHSGPGRHITQKCVVWGCAHMVPFFTPHILYMVSFYFPIRPKSCVYLPFFSCCHMILTTCTCRCHVLNPTWLQAMCISLSVHSVLGASCVHLLIWSKETCFWGISRMLLVKFLPLCGHMQQQRDNKGTWASLWEGPSSPAKANHACLMSKMP